MFVAQPGARMKKILFLLFPVTVFAQVSTNRLDEILKGHPGFSGVLLVAQTGKPVYHKAVGYREFAKQIPLKKKMICLSWHPSPNNSPP